ncbi:MAG: uncharacterized protein K0Q99_1437 [Clostridia bacterium]|jgi:AcrR family transcriptional regulator|nr:uncharacterized protein [Clostridia bacterium]
MKNENGLNNKKDIQKQRNKMYFLEAAKELIVKEGVENVSVRKVADKAGYSYATIYNYFEDLNELLVDVRSLLIGDIAVYMHQKINEPLYDLDGIKKLLRTYIAYYFENPNVFKFFYFHQLRKTNKCTDDIQEPNFEEIWKATFKGFVLDGTIAEQDIEVLSKILIYSMHGMIAICFSYDGSLTEEKVYKDLEQIIDYLLIRK